MEVGCLGRISKGIWLTALIRGCKLEPLALSLAAQQPLLILLN